RVARGGVLVWVCARGRSCVTRISPGGASRDGGALVAQKAAGEACTEGRECQSAFCADKVCCKTMCDGPCVTCAKSGSEGICMPADVGMNPRGKCVDMGAAKCS